MTIADILTFVGIAVSIIFGFFVTHICSIRDTRTRVLKDYYIEQVKGIKGRVGDFFHKVAFGKGSFRKVVSWYDHLAIDVKGTDQGVRKSLDLQIAEFMDILDQYYGEITNWEDFNNQYSASRYIPSTEHKSRLLQMKYEIDEFLNDYVHHINQSNNYPIWKVQYRRIKQSYYYYKGKGYKCAFCRSIWERTEKHFWECIIVLAIIGITIFLISKVSIEKKDDLYTPLNNISNKQDSIYREIHLFNNNYKPVEIQSKTFNNSSFFSADRVDSVQIKLYQGQPKQ
ncbi:hypothetical protein ACIXQX_14095 [Bacteroides fragilis]|uniref:hypothetical protein n=1 Tax=Bacteroides sp. 90-K9/2 TaxID=3142453 RepID=UPI0038521226